MMTMMTTNPQTVTKRIVEELNIPDENCIEDAVKFGNCLFEFKYPETDERGVLVMYTHIGDAEQDLPEVHTSLFAKVKDEDDIPGLLKKMRKHMVMEQL